MAQRYGKRPIEIVDPTGTFSDYAGYCFDEAIAMRAILEENRAIKDAEKKAREQNPDDDASHEKSGAAQMDVSTGKILGNISGKVGEPLDDDLMERYIRAGGVWKGKLPASMQKKKG